jgi:hypothetical protein
MIRVVTFLFVLLSTLLTAKAQQQNTPNLSQLHIGAGFLPVLSFSPDSLDYNPSEMMRFTVGFNYLTNGYFKYNFQYGSLASSNPQHPDCHLFDNSLSYLYYFRLPRNIAIYSGAQLGLNTVLFDGDEASLGDRKRETEVSSGLEIGVEIRVIPSLGLSGSYKLQRIFATPRNTLSMIDIGVIYYFKPNDKIKQWLE